MPAQTERLLWRFLGGAQFGQKSASGAKTAFDNAGRQTMAGSARAYRAVYVKAQDFFDPSPSPAAVSACTSGSIYPASLLIDITGSAFAGATGSMLTIRTLNMGAGASPASTLKAFAMIERPLDADTTGSIIAYVDWTYGDVAATTGSTTKFEVAMGYLGGFAGTACAVRTAASAGGLSNASYSGTTCGTIQTTCVGKLPSWGQNDTHAVVALAIGASAAAESGKLSTGCLHIIGMRFHYVACALGFAVNE